jgi:hypothetical protein
MFRRVSAALAAAFMGTALFLAPAAEAQAGTAVVRVQVPKPVLTVKVRPMKPGPNYVWVEGHRSVRNHWIPGHWRHQPARSVVVVKHRHHHPTYRTIRVR